MTYRRLVGFGEAMLRLTAPRGGTVETAPAFAASVGGAELNGLIAAVRSGMPGTWVSALPDNALGRLVLRHARANGVEPHVVAAERSEDARLGLYFLEMAASPRPLQITYDRRESAFARLDPDAVRWEELLSPATCLYLTGITPPLGNGPRKALDNAIQVARAVGACVALDVNYRSGLWPRAEADRWLASVLPDVDVLSAGVHDLRGAGLDGSDVLAQAVERFGLRAVVMTGKRQEDACVDLDVRVATPDGEHRTAARAVVADPLDAGDALFGTFLARFPAGDIAAAAARARGAAITCYGLAGDALVADPWDRAETRGVVR
jgi:2-dehydro-3-deoxygluconokinase